MANEYLVNASDLTNVANSIKNKANISHSLVFPDEFITTISSIKNPFFIFEKAGTMEIGYTKTTLDISHIQDYQNISLNEIYFVPTNFIITATDQITAGTYNINKSYSNGVITAWRDSVPGKVGVAFTCNVYVYKSTTEVKRVIKIGDNQPLTYGAGISIDVSSIVNNYDELTENDFYLDLKKIDINVTQVGGGSANIIKTYDASTGIFNFSRASISFSGSMNNYCDVYMCVPC